MGLRERLRAQIKEWDAANKLKSPGREAVRFEVGNALRNNVKLAADAIEAHEAFRQEVSNAIETLLEWPSIRSQDIIVHNLTRFIIPEPKPDPLVEAMSEAMCGVPDEDYTRPAQDIRNALAKRWLKISKIKGGDDVGWNSCATEKET